MSNDAIVLLSGGIDSAACAWFLRDRGHSIKGLFVDYGQRAVLFEKRSAEALSTTLGIALDCISVSTPNQFGAGEVIGRNAFLVFAALLSSRLHSGVIALGIHSGTTYYDCSSAFARSIDRLLAEHTDGRVRLSAPFITWSKKNIFDYYEASGLPIDLTYSCEAGSMPPCGTCLSCRDRRVLGC
jgi:7-cyano-7-deazaguanine synthase